MSKLTKRQRLKRDPANQRLHKLKAWVGRNGHVVEPTIMLPGLMHPPRLTWLKRHRNKYFDRLQEVTVQR